jgi:hypothetical protein
VLLDPPPPGLDAVRATATARRSHRRRRRFTVSVAAALLLATGAVAGVVATGYDRAEPVPPADYDRCVARPGAVPTGVTVTAADHGGPADPPGPTGVPGDRSLEAVVVRGGAVTRIAVPGVRAPSYPVGVDRSGTVVGFSDTSDDEATRIPWVHRDGVTTRLPLPAGYTGARLDGVNAWGDVAGTAFRRRGTELERVGVVWPGGAHDSPVVTTPGPGISVEIVGIADDGTVVGRTVRSAAGVHSYAWRPDGPVRRLEASVDGWSTVVGGVNGRWAYGFVQSADGTSAAARWNLAAGTVETFPDLAPTTAAISPDGVLVLNDPAEAAVVVVDAAGGVHRLPPAPSATAVAISDDGRTIAGSAVWTC